MRYITLDKYTEQVLEFPRIKEIVATECVTESGKVRARSAQPFADPAEVEHELALLVELHSLIKEYEILVLDGLPDIVDLLKKVQPIHAHLHAEEYRSIAHFTELVDTCKRFFKEHRDVAPNCYIKFNAMVSLKDLTWVINNKIDAKGEVKDDASPHLKELRREIHHLDHKIHSHLEHLINSFRDTPVLQDYFYSIRNGRYVLPVRSGSKKQLPGIIQGASNTGETLFIEPFDIVEETNDLTDLRIQETNEIRKILIAIGEAVRHHMPALVQNAELMEELDYLNARARFALKYGLNVPEPGSKRTKRLDAIDLRNTHHPLLFIHNRDNSISIDLSLRPIDRVLVITGPNAGGKTTTLKTLGLTVLMFQTALPVACAVDSRFIYFSGVFADIGDEQDVQLGLSTFTAHVKNISRILQEATPDSLVLLDELGTATDPNEGAAIGVAVLEDLSEKAALTVVTSHLAGLKEWAHTFPAARNAGVKLDEATRMPSYKLFLDVPGSSEALVIAEKEGLPEPIINRARNILTHDELNLSDLILSLQQKEQTLDKKMRLLDTEIGKAQRSRERHEREAAELEREKKEWKHNLLQKQEQILKEAREKIERMIAELPTRQALSHAREEIKAESEKINRELGQIQKELKPIPKELKHIQEGDIVHVPSFNQYGRVTAINQRDDVVEVQIKNMSVQLPLSHLEPVNEEQRQKVMKTIQSQETGIRFRIREGAEYSIDLHGMTTEEAVAKVDKFLDNAIVHNLPFVKIIHGYGSGKLRRELHAFLSNHPYVKSYHFALPEEGGAAATIVDFVDE